MCFQKTPPKAFLDGPGLYWKSDSCATFYFRDFEIGIFGGTFSLNKSKILVPRITLGLLEPTLAPHAPQNDPRTTQD